MKRFRTLQTASGSELVILHVVESDVESEMHFKFSDYRSLGEWFDDTDGKIASYLELLQDSGNAIGCLNTSHV